MNDVAAPLSPPNPPPAVCLVVLNWNGRELLDSCLASLTRQTYPNFHLLVVDNASNDGSPAAIRHRFPDVELIENTANLGFTRGTNVGLQAAFDAGYELIIALNNDVSAPPDWLGRLVAAMTADPTIGIAGCKLLYPDQQTIQHAGAEITRPLAHNHHFHQFEPDTGQADTPRDVDYVTGAVLAIRRPVIAQVGVLDERFGPFYYEEVDLCYRARQAGWRVVYLPQATAIHHESYSVKQIKFDHQPTYQLNRLRFVAKWWTTAEFSDSFVPAEIAELQQMTNPYLVTVVRAAAEKAAREVDQPDLAAGLSRIAQAAAWRLQQLIPTRFDLMPKLTFWRFESSWPLIGRLRQLWLNIAARWYVDHAVDQLARRNIQLYTQNQSLLEMVQGLKYEIELLRQEQTRLADALEQLKPTETEKDDPNATEESRP